MSASALIVAHPGHEIRAYGWYEQAKPTLFVLTDGGGSNEDGRLHHSRIVAQNVGAPISALFGNLTDRETYDALLRRDPAPFLDWTGRLAAALQVLDPALVVVDSWQLYNVAHDLVHVMTRVAANHAGRRRGRNIRLIEFDPAPAALAGPTAPRGNEAFRVELDEPALARKLTAAKEFVNLQQELDAVVALEGLEAQRTEIYREASDFSMLTVPGGTIPAYERFGEQRVATGRYQECIRWNEHVAPIVAALCAAQL
jgi:hypothetical protein